MCVSLIDARRLWGNSVINIFIATASGVFLSSGLKYRFDSEKDASGGDFFYLVILDAGIVYVVFLLLRLL